LPEAVGAFDNQMYQVSFTAAVLATPLLPKGVKNWLLLLWRPKVGLNGLGYFLKIYTQIRYMSLLCIFNN
jgi:uncharacterized membrane protein YiaA